MVKDSNEIVIFNAAYENGNEKFMQVLYPNAPKFVLRKNLCIDDSNGGLIWNESQRTFGSIAEYLSEINPQIINYTPIEIHPDYTETFKSTLLSGLRLISQKAELAFFNTGNGFNKWMRWAKHFQQSSESQTTGSISLYGFGKRTPISQIKIDLPMIATIQQLLDNVYTSFLINTYRPGRFGKDWTLYNLSRCQTFGAVPRNLKPSPDFVNTGDDLAVLRLTPT